MIVALDSSETNNYSGPRGVLSMSFLFTVELRVLELDAEKFERTPKIWESAL